MCHFLGYFQPLIDKAVDRCVVFCVRPPMCIRRPLTHPPDPAATPPHLPPLHSHLSFSGTCVQVNCFCPRFWLHKGNYFFGFTSISFCKRRRYPSARTAPLEGVAQGRQKHRNSHLKRWFPLNNPSGEQPWLCNIFAPYNICDQSARSAIIPVRVALFCCNHAFIDSLPIRQESVPLAPAFFGVTTAQGRRGSYSFTSPGNAMRLPRLEFVGAPFLHPLQFNSVAEGGSWCYLT